MKLYELHRKKVVKYLCYDNFGRLFWIKSDETPPPNSWIRRPAFDKECEVDDES